MAHGEFCWNELMTTDVEAAKQFFADTIGWTYQGMPIQHGTYWLAHMNGKPVAGIMAMQGVVPDGTPPHWVSYLAVDDVDARVARLTAAGGTVCRSSFDVPGVGRIAIIADATGAVMGWITPLTP